MCQQKLDTFQLFGRGLKTAVVAHKGYRQSLVCIGVGPVPAAAYVDIALLRNLVETNTEI